MKPSPDSGARSSGRWRRLEKVGRAQVCSVVGSSERCAEMEKNLGPGAREDDRQANRLANLRFPAPNAGDVGFQQRVGAGLEYSHGWAS